MGHGDGEGKEMGKKRMLTEMERGGDGYTLAEGRWR